MYRVQLQNFEGPLDLLLFFIKRDELDIYDIPISYITDQFLEYIHFLEELDLNIASEFILMASTLMAIKARLMLPHDEDAFEDDPEADPRYELVQALLEYKRYREMAEELHIMDVQARNLYNRGNRKADVLEPEVDSGEVLKNITLFDLMTAFKKIMTEARREEVYHNVERIPSSIEEQSVHVIEQLRERGRLSFQELCSAFVYRIKMVVTFLAVLELIKERTLQLFLGELPTEFYLELNPEADPDRVIREYQDKMAGGNGT